MQRRAAGTACLHRARRPAGAGPGQQLRLDHRSHRRARASADALAWDGGPASASAWCWSLALLITMTVLIAVGIGVWGVMIPVAWGFAITSFVWWIGIGHAGTLISAILFLLKQQWRTSINRFAEAMTIFAVMQAGLYPVFHLGRPWFAYWLVPYPATMNTWPQFRSPLVWDFFAVSTYFTVSLIFWYPGHGAGPGQPARSSSLARQAGHLRPARPGLARLGAPLAEVRARLLSARRAGDAAGRLRAQRGEQRLRGRDRARLARDHLSALLRRGRALLRLCHGADHRHPAARRLRLAGLRHHPPPRHHGQIHARHRAGGRLLLSHRALHRLVQRQPVRALPAHQSRLRTLRPVVLGGALLQRRRHPDAVVQAGPHDAARTLRESAS